jgi:hypothetical protein
MICVYDNNAGINNNYCRLQDIIFLFKIFISPRKYFFEMYRQCGQAPSKRFAIPGLRKERRDSPQVAIGLDASMRELSALTLLQI